jgi:hypothetical protein
MNMMNATASCKLELAEENQQQQQQDVACQPR